MDSNSSEQRGLYQYAEHQSHHGSTIIFASWPLKHGRMFIPKVYNLPVGTYPPKMDTVVIRCSSMQWREYMNFACQIGAVCTAQWMTVPGTEYSRGWIKYYWPEDAQKCYRELVGNRYCAGMTNAPYMLPCESGVESMPGEWGVQSMPVEWEAQLMLGERGFGSMCGKCRCCAMFLVGNYIPQGYQRGCYSSNGR